MAVLRGGYRPRSLTVEINRNFTWHDSYATVDMPQEMAFTADGCATLTGQACGAAAYVGELLSVSDTDKHRGSARDSAMQQCRTKSLQLAVGRQKTDDANMKP
jgi:hypothetical protein